MHNHHLVPSFRRWLVTVAAIFAFLFLFWGMQDVYAAKQDVDVVLIGDSYAVGLNRDIKPSQRVSTPWPSIVTKQLGTSQYLLKCRSGAGFLRTLSDGANFSTLLRDSAVATKAASVQKVIVVGGFNDMYWSYDTLFPCVSEFVLEARELFPNAEIIIGMGGYHASNPDIQTRLMTEVYPAYLDGAEASGGHYITGLEHVLPGNNSWFSADQFHPNELGHRLLGIHIAHYIKTSTSPLAVNGFTQQADTYAYYQNGTINSSITKIVRNPWNDKWYFMSNGVYDSSFTGVAKSISNGKWYFVRNGILDRKFTGIARSSADRKWYFVRNGKLDWNFTGLAKNVSNGKWYFVRKGQLNLNFTGIAKSASNGAWYFVRRGRLDQKFTGLAKSVSNGKWYFVSKGKLNRRYTGYVKGPDRKKHYVKNGQLVR